MMKDKDQALNTSLKSKLITDRLKFTSRNKVTKELGKANFVNISLTQDQGSFPQYWKPAVVVSIFTIDNSHSVSSKKTVSILPTFIGLSANMWQSSARSLLRLPGVLRNTF